MRKTLIAIITIAFCLGFVSAVNAAEQKKPVLPPARPVVHPMRTNFAMLFGSISKIDNKDPSKPVLEIKSETDNVTHRIELTPLTSITKFTDISELKTGDEVRVMTRKVDGKEIAMGVMFGKIRNLPIPKSLVPAKLDTPKK